MVSLIRYIVTKRLLVIVIKQDILRLYKVGLGNSFLALHLSKTPKNEDLSLCIGMNLSVLQIIIELQLESRK